MNFSYKINSQSFSKKEVFAIFLFALIAGIIPFHHSLLFWDSAFLYRDLGILYMPGKFLWAKNILEHRAIPAWNFNALSGTPFIAEPSNGSYNPLNLILLFFPKKYFLIAFTYFIAAHISLIYAGTCLLLRELKVSLWLALVMAFTFSWSGFVMGISNLIHSLSGIASIGFFLFFWIRYLRQESILQLLGASFFLAFPIFGGDPQYTYMLALIGAALLALRKYRWDLFFKKMGALTVLSIMCSAAQLLPMIELFYGSERAPGKFGPSEIYAWCLHPIQLWEFIFPLFFGSIASKNEYIGAQAMDVSDIPLIFSNYLGVLFLFSFFTVLFFRSKKIKLYPIKNDIILFGLATVGLFISMGIYAPINIYHYMVKTLPFWAGFRFPSRFAIWPIYCLLLWCVIFVENYLHYIFNAPSRANKYWLFILLIFGFFGYLIIPHLPLPRQNIFSMQYSFLLLSLLVLVLILFLSKILSKRIFLFLFFGIVLMDFATVSNQLVWLEPLNIFRLEEQPTIQKILKDAELHKTDISAGAAFRFFSVNPSFAGMTGRVAEKNLDIPSAMQYVSFERLAGNTSAYFGLNNMVGYFSINDHEKLNFWDSFSRDNPSRAINLMAARYILKEDSSQEVGVFINPDALPYFYAPQNTVVNPTDPMRILRDDGFDIKKSAIIESFVDRRKNVEKFLFAAPNFVIQILRRDSDTLHAKVVIPSEISSFFLGWNESYDKYWSASLQGKKIPIEKLNHWAMAIELKDLTPGNYDLIFTYSNPLVAWGQILSGLWLLVLVSVIIRRNWRISF